MRSKKPDLKFLGDLAKMATGAFGSLEDVKHQVKSMVKERVTQVIDELDLVSRREFDRVEAMAQKARERQEELEKRLAALEKSGGARKPALKKPASGATHASRKGKKKK